MDLSGRMAERDRKLGMERKNDGLEPGWEAIERKGCALKILSDPAIDDKCGTYWETYPDTEAKSPAGDLGKMYRMKLAEMMRRNYACVARQALLLAEWEASSSVSDTWSFWASGPKGEDSSASALV
jgi:hypothetical protein